MAASGYPVWTRTGTRISVLLSIESGIEVVVCVGYARSGGNVGKFWSAWKFGSSVRIAQGLRYGLDLLFALFVVDVFGSPLRHEVVLEFPAVINTNEGIHRTRLTSQTSWLLSQSVDTNTMLVWWKNHRTTASKNNISCRAR